MSIGELILTVACIGDLREFVHLGCNPRCSERHPSLHPGSPGHGPHEEPEPQLRPASQQSSRSVLWRWLKGLRQNRGPLPHERERPGARDARRRRLERVLRADDPHRPHRRGRRGLSRGVRVGGRRPARAGLPGRLFDERAGQLLERGEAGVLLV